MANPVGFDGAMTLLKAAPEDAAAGTVRDLPIFVDQHQIISCWRLTPEELAEVTQTGVVWLSVVNVGGYAPSLISGHALIKVDGRDSIAEPYIPGPNGKRT